MEFLKNLLPGKKKEHKLGVCVPEHQKNMKVRGEWVGGKQVPAELASRGTFLVDGIYKIQGVLMLSGKARTGIKLGATAQINDHDVTVQEIRVKGKQEDALPSGTKGSLFVTDAPVSVRTGDALTFVKESG